MGRVTIRKPSNDKYAGRVGTQLIAKWNVSVDGKVFHEQWGYSKNRWPEDIDFDSMLEETRRSAMGGFGGSDLITEGPLDFYWKRFEFQEE